MSQENLVRSHETREDTQRQLAPCQPEYFSCLLRLWQASEANEPRGMKPVWRATLEISLTGERKGFASLDDLFDFLREKTAGLEP